MIWQTLPLPMKEYAKESAPVQTGVSMRVPEWVPERASVVEPAAVRVPLAALEDLIDELWEAQRKEYFGLRSWLRPGHLFEHLSRLKFFAAEVKAHRGRLNLR